MLYLIDSANLNAIKKCCEFYPVSGVTTNPTIVSRENTDFKNLVYNIRDIIGSHRMLHVQTTSENSADIVNEAKLLRGILGDNFYIKIPISPEGLKATMLCKDLGINVTMTAIFTQQQALMAACSGADFVAPYVNRLDNIVSDGVLVVNETVDIFRSYNLPAKILAASFKTVEQVHKISMTGAHAITINPDLFDMVIYHPLTNTAISDFNKDWDKVYNGKTIPELMK